MGNDMQVVVADAVEYRNNSGVRLGVVLTVAADSGELEIAPLFPDELITDGDLFPKSTDNSKTRKIVTVDASQVTKRVGTVKQSVVGQLWNEAAKYAAVQHYRNVHHPRQHKPFKEGDRLSYAGRVFDEREVLNLVDASLEFWLTTGRYSEQFEERYAKFLGVRKALLVNSGSSANLVAFMTLTSPRLKERQIKRGDEVITVAAGFPTTVAPAIQYGAVPVFIDVDPITHNIDVSMLEAARSEKTKAVMIAHALGNPFDLGAVKAFCDTYNLWLVEDNCDALGAEYFIDGSWKLTGTIGDIGTSSFYPPHHMTMGEGGAVYMKSPVLAKIAASFRDWGRDCYCPAGVDNTCGKRFDWKLGELPEGYDHKYIYSHFGFNLKVTDMQAAVGCAQLDKIKGFVEARRKNFDLLKESLREVEDIFVLPEATPNSKPSWFGFLLSLRDPSAERRGKIVRGLEERGIQTRMLFAGNYTRHPVFDEIRGDESRYRIVGDLRNSDYIMSNGFWVGVYPGLTEPMIRHMAKVIIEVARSSQGKELVNPEKESPVVNEKTLVKSAV
jgi:CDP-6-deoxy-D-xylo-4-hexulose-3-dehydrase